MIVIIRMRILLSKKPNIRIRPNTTNHAVKLHREPKNCHYTIVHSDPQLKFSLRLWQYLYQTSFCSANFWHTCTSINVLPSKYFIFFYKIENRELASFPTLQHASSPCWAVTRILALGPKIRDGDRRGLKGQSPRRTRPRAEWSPWGGGNQPSLYQTRGFGERCKFPRLGPGPGRQAFCCIL